jgi:hypothetical protein
MTPKVRRLAVILGAPAALGAAGSGEAASAQNNFAASGTTARRRHAERGSASAGEAQTGPGGFDATALAGLDVSASSAATGDAA